MPSRHPFNADDRAQLAARGVAESEALRQLALLASPPPPARLVRPCTPGDGIHVVPEARIESLLARHAEAAAAGRVSVLVPASGAATRMFKDLIAAESLPGVLEPAAVRAAAEAGSAPAQALVRFVEGLPQLALVHLLDARLMRAGLDRSRLAAEGPWRPLLETLVGTTGLDLAHSPKGLLPFHRERGVVRTAFEEHLGEAAALCADVTGLARMHFTVSPEHRGGFASQLGHARAGLEAGGPRLEVGFSEQQAATDTIAADPQGGPFRDSRGGLVFRPAGHGALLANLEALAGDLVFIKNIDNVAVARVRGEGVRWARVLLGLVSECHARGRELLARLAATADDLAVDEARAFVREWLGTAIPDGVDDRAWLRERLDRPWRVAGMVANTGEPGGGPFWVRGDDDAVTPQVVESAQVDLADPAQAARFRASSHFNPVFLACALRDPQGHPYPLEPFVDPAAVIVTAKSHQGRDLLALERPGLWNGAMARWNTVFVEVPLAVFNPVKTVFDLLRPEHQGED
jgi:hypothetical protein